MRVSSNASALSRRSMMRGLAFALAGASVPVAAIAGATARKLMTGDDTELLKRCSEWHDRRRRMKRIEKELRRIWLDTMTRMPETPPELYKDVQFSTYPVSPSNGAFVGGFSRNGGYAWSREELTRMIDGKHPLVGADDGYGKPSPECQAHCRKLLVILDSHEAEEGKLLAPYNRLDDIWSRENSKNWRLFNQIIRVRATTLQGAAAQLRVIELEGALTQSHGEAVNGHVLSVARNLGRLVAAMPVEA